MNSPTVALSQITFGDRGIIEVDVDLRASKQHWFMARFAMKSDFS
jgi:hypothetical protein